MCREWGEARRVGYDCKRAGANDECRLAATAFRHVLGKKQSSYGQVIAWLDDQLTHSPLLHDAKEATRMRRIANKGNALFGGYKF